MFPPGQAVCQPHASCPMSVPCLMSCATQPRFQTDIAWLMDYLPWTNQIYIIDEDYRQPLHRWCWCPLSVRGIPLPVPTQHTGWATPYLQPRGTQCCSGNQKVGTGAARQMGQPAQWQHHDSGYIPARERVRCFHPRMSLTDLARVCHTSIDTSFLSYTGRKPNQHCRRLIIITVHDDDLFKLSSDLYSIS